VREDPKKKDLLFAGTETGVFVSYDGGNQWQSLQLNLPTTPVHDLVIHDNDLVLATHGRAFWVLDDITPLRQYSSSIAQQDVHLYTPATAYRVRMPHSWDKPMNEGENPPNGAEIYFNLKSMPKQASIEILDSKGELVRKVTSKDVKDLDEPADPDDEKPKKEMELQAGMNRFVWDLRYQEVPRLPNYYLYEYQGGTRGPMVLPGEYQVRLTVDGKSYTAPLQVKLDPREHVSLADLEKQVTLTRQIQAELTRVYEAVNQIWDLRAQTHELQKHLASSEGGAKLVYTASQQLDEKIADVEDALVQMKISANEDSLRYPPGLDAKLSYLANYVEGDNDSAPTAVAYQEFDNLKKQSDAQLARWSGIVNTDLVNFENLMQQQKVRALFVTGTGTSSAGPAK